MDVRIGVSQAPREIEVELADSTNADDLVAKIDAAVAKADRDALVYRQAWSAHRGPGGKIGVHRAGHGHRDAPRRLRGRRLSHQESSSSG